MSSTDEEWRDIVGYEGAYEVSDHGTVRSVDRVSTDGSKRRGKILKPWDIGSGHLAVSLYRGSKRAHRQVHRLVCEAFHGPAPAGKPFVLHWDDVSDNNHASNLRWGTAKENGEDSRRNERRTYLFAEKEHCTHGHELSEENSFYRPNRRNRECRQCMRDRSKGYYWAKKGLKDASTDND